MELKLMEVLVLNADLMKVWSIRTVASLVIPVDIPNVVNTDIFF